MKYNRVKVGLHVRMCDDADCRQGQHGVVDEIASQCLVRFDDETAFRFYPREFEPIPFCNNQQVVVLVGAGRYEQRTGIVEACMTTDALVRLYDGVAPIWFRNDELAPAPNAKKSCLHPAGCTFCNWCGFRAALKQGDKVKVVHQSDFFAGCTGVVSNLATPISSTVKIIWVRINGTTSGGWYSLSQLALVQEEKQVDNEIPKEVNGYIGGNKINEIKFLRSRYPGLSLQESKNIVDKREAQSAVKPLVDTINASVAAALKGYMKPDDIMEKLRFAVVHLDRLRTGAATYYEPVS